MIDHYFSEKQHQDFEKANSLDKINMNNKVDAKPIVSNKDSAVANGCNAPIVKTVNNILSPVVVNKSKKKRRRSRSSSSSSSSPSSSTSSDSDEYVRRRHKHYRINKRKGKSKKKHMRASSENLRE